MKPSIRCTYVRHAGGVTLIELMISMVLGLVVIGGAIGVIQANRQSYRTNEALSQVQESARTAFELLARDVRQAGVNGCTNTGRIANVLRPASNRWWQTWFGIRGYEGNMTDPAVAFGTAPGERWSGTDSIQLQGIEGLGLSVENHNPTSANVKINATTTDLVENDILMICDFDHAAILQVTNYNSQNVTVVHSSGQGVSSPGNCSHGLGYPTDCSSIPGNPYTYGPNSQVARFAAVDWYIGANGRAEEGGRSLYRRRLGSGATMQVEEIVAGVTNMQLQYREQGRPDFRDANLVDVWTNVNTVRIELTMQSTDQRVSTDVTVSSGRLERDFTTFVTLRNRVP